MFKKENLRKNFLRVKQNIDQNLGRAEKSEVLSEDQQENEKRVDIVKHAFQNITKKAGALLQAQGTEHDKRLKKLPETALGNAMLESAVSLGPESLLGNACQLCGDCQLNLAKEQVEFEMKLEQEFIVPLQNIVDVDIPSIMKLRKALSKSTLDMDSAKTRFNQAVRQSHVPGANMANAAAKADQIREEFEEASQKVEAIKDGLSIELCNFASKESEHSSRLLLLLEAQADYHKKTLEAILDCIPQMKQAIDNSPSKPCYGMALKEHLRLMCRDIATVLEACVLTLLECGMEEEGLFRIAGAAMKLKKLKACFDGNAVDMEEFINDPHTVAGALKQYLRELPEPLLTYDLYDDFMQAATLPQDQRLQTLWTVVNRLPKTNYNNFRYLVKFLAKLAEKSDVNKMKPSNIAIVIGPNLLWSEKSNAPSMMTTGTVSAIIEAIVTHADWFFPGAFDFHLTGHGSSPKPCREPGYAFQSQDSTVLEKEQPDKDIDNLRLRDIIRRDEQPNSQEESGESGGEEIKILPVEQSSVDLLLEFPPPKAKMVTVESLEDDESSEDENNPFSEKSPPDHAHKFDRADKSGKGDHLSSMPFLLSGRRNGQYIVPSSTNTGDYDNILYSINPQSSVYRGSNLSRSSTLGSADRRGSADSALAPVPPSRPSRISKRNTPFTSEQNCPYATMSRSVLQSPNLSGHSTLDSLHSPPQSSRQPNAQYLAGSTPNISSLSASNKTEEDVFTGFHSGMWNRPNQKSDFHSLKRGSDPCIIPPPPQFSTFNQQRNFKISRSQLGAPPKPRELPRSQSTPQDNITKSDQKHLENDTSRCQQSPGQIPVDKSFHQDTYSTAFALTSLGAGNTSTDYLTKVRAMWDDHHLQQPARAGLSGESLSPNSMGTGVNGRGMDRCSPSFKVSPTSGKHKAGTTKQGSPGLLSCSSPCSHHIPPSGSSSPMPAAPAEIDFNSVGYEDETDGSQTQTTESEAQNSMEALHIQVAGPTQTTAQNTVQQSSPGGSPAPSTNSSSSTNLHVPSDSPDLGPVQRRLARKPAPPPPAERPFTVKVTAATQPAVAPKPGSDAADNGGSASNGNNNQSATWPRVAPLASPESPSDQPKQLVGQEKDKHRPSERPSMPPPDRPGPPPPPERPRLPPVLNPPVSRGHQRSASTGAMIHHPTTMTYDGSSVSGVPNAGSLSSYSICEGSHEDASLNDGVGFEGANSSGNSHNVGVSGSGHTLGRQASMRPRPTPPPPPPPPVPIAKESENTKL